MKVTPCELHSGRPSEDKNMSRPRAPCVAVWVKAPDSIMYLDLAIETGIQDIDLAFVCRPRLLSKHFDPPGNKRYLCSHRKSLWHLISHRCPFPPSSLLILVFSECVPLSSCYSTYKEN